jgi:Glycoside hydrolase family 2 C-terminal domain 5
VYGRISGGWSTSIRVWQAGSIKRDCREHIFFIRPSYGTTCATAVGQKGKTTVRHELRTAGDPERVSLRAQKTTLNADGRDVSFIEANVVDREGTTVPAARPWITFAATGPARLLGGTTQIDAISGVAAINVQSTGLAGEVIVETSSPELGTGSVRLNSEEQGVSFVSTRPSLHVCNPDLVGLSVRALDADGVNAKLPNEERSAASATSCRRRLPSLIPPLLLLAFLYGAAIPGVAAAAGNSKPLAAVPPMGWNDWATTSAATRQRRSSTMPRHWSARVSPPLATTR